MPYYEAETSPKKRLSALPSVILGMNHGRNAPLNLTNDMNLREITLVY
jgi:hypothetical protein